jgi:hypothetical protein
MFTDSHILLERIPKQRPRDHISVHRTSTPLSNKLTPEEDEAFHQRLP